LGARSDGQQYAGPDFEVIDLILARFAPLLETARLYQQANRDAVALRDAYEKLKELDKLKDQFITTASHELRTPLTAVQGYIELLQNYNERLSTEERAVFIAKAQRGCDELTLMVSNIMDSSHVEVDIQEVSMTAVPLAASVAHVLEIMEGVTRRENRCIELNISDDIVVEADDLRLRQIILNLVSNALKYSPAGSPLEISASVESQTVTLRIRDYGRGVPFEDQARLFERFVRLERDMNSPVRGVGLGLAISKQLVQAMGGRVWVESSGEEGKGSVFAFSLRRDPSVQALAS
jgi:signal transduction histidine kinase